MSLPADLRRFRARTANERAMCVLGYLLIIAGVIFIVYGVALLVLALK